MASLRMRMMIRDPLIGDFSGRGASHLSGVIAEPRSLGEKTSLRMSLSDPLAASGMNNPSIRKSIHSDEVPPLDSKTASESIIFLI
jgi:hypothetical protein